MSKLTIKQKMVLEAIEYFIKENGYPPTIREIAKLLNIKYVNSIFNIMYFLEEKGYIKTTNGKARSIVILRRVNDDK